jgi:hypothetical protein
MISIIICSVNPVFLSNVSKNIAETIGTPFEIIAVDNSKDSKGICAVYNKAASKAKYPFLCFMHEDISIDTMNWGKLVCEHLSGERSGLLGVAGGDTKSMAPSSWSIPVISNEINLWQHYKFNERLPERILCTNGAFEGNKKKVVTLDGVWLCTKKEVFQQFIFDEKMLKGFHGYDIDYSLQVGTKYNVYVVFDIVIHHYSQGTPDRKWVDSAIAVSRKWKSRLPVSVYDLPKHQFTWHHWHTLQVFIKHLFRLKYSYLQITRFFLAYSFTRYFTIRRFLSMGKFVLQHMYNPGHAAAAEKAETVAG